MIFLATAALAEPAAEGSADLRAIETLPDDLVLDAEGDTLEWGPAVDTRLRLDGKAHQGPLRAELQGDLFSGQLFGATWNLGGLDERGRNRDGALTAGGVVPRVAMIGARLPWFDVAAGLQTSQWGLGMLANDGDHDPSAAGADPVAPLFGRTDFGDRVLRLQLATAPFGRSLQDRVPLYVVIAGDRVVADELARWSAGDDAWEGVAAVLYTKTRPTPAGPVGAESGIYGVYRSQVDAERLPTRATAVDGYALVGRELGGWIGWAGAEGAVTTGHTRAAATYTARRGLAVRAGGFAVRSALGTHDGRLLLHARAAYASGDRSGDDGVVGDFRFDRDYDVGFVLFDEVESALDLGARREAKDPTVAAQAPPGVDTLVAEGAFHQAFALQPAVQVAATRWLEARAGTVFAWSTAPIAQPFATFRNGGVPTNMAGVATDGRYLGTELDWGLATRAGAVEQWKLRPSAFLQVGHAWPSRELAPGLGRVDHLLLVGQLAL